MAVQPYSNLAQAYPNLSQTTQQTSANILQRLRGELSPETQRAIQDISATYGITSGAPGSGFVANRTARDLGRATEDVQRAGQQDFLAALQAYSGTIAPTVGQQMQQDQFGQELDFRKQQAGLDYDLRRDAFDLEKRKLFPPKPNQGTYHIPVANTGWPGSLEGLMGDDVQRAGPLLRKF